MKKFTLSALAALMMSVSASAQGSVTTTYVKASDKNASTVLSMLPLVLVTHTSWYSVSLSARALRVRLLMLQHLLTLAAHQRFLLQVL